MIGEEFIGKKPVTLVDVKRILKERKKEKELTYEQERAYSYARTFAKLTQKRKERLASELAELETIDKETACKILDIMPAEIEIMKLVPGDKKDISEEDLKKALEIIKKYVK